MRLPILNTLIQIMVFVSIFCIHSLSAQGPWSPGKGHGYAQLLYNTVPSYTTIFDGDSGSRDLERALSETDLILYGEIGLTPRLAVGSTIPYISVSSGESNPRLSSTPTLPAGSLGSLGNLSLFGKYTFIQKVWNVALISQVDFPTSSQSLLDGLSTGVDTYTIQPKLTAGRSTANAFFYGFVSYGYRTRDFNDFVNFGVEVGLTANEKVSLILNINRWQNLDNGDPSVDSPANITTGFYTSFQEYTGYLFKIFVQDIYKGFGGFLSLGGGGGADSVAASPALSLGAFYKW